MRKTISKIAALLGAAVLTTGMMAVSAAAADPLNICIITSSGVDDGNFNQDCYNGILTFLETHSDCKVTDIKESDLSQLVPTVEKSVGDYDVFVLPGFNFASCGDVVKNNPDKKFLIVDATVQDSEGNPVSAAEVGNLYTMTFKEQESGFFAGLAAALTSTSGKVAVINGIAFPSNVNYEYGFMAGVNYANAKYGTSVECVELPSYAGTDLGGNNVGGNYVGDFADEATGKVVAEALIAEGCDVLFPAAGASGNGVFTAAKESETPVYVIGCDVDQYDDGAKGDGNIVLTSALKLMHTNVTRQLEAIYDGTFAGEDAMLGADTDSTGFISDEGRHQLSEDTLAKMNECYELLKAGEIVPPDGSGTPDDFPGLA